MHGCLKEGNDNNRKRNLVTREFKSSHLWTKVPQHDSAIVRGRRYLLHAWIESDRYDARFVTTERAS